MALINFFGCIEPQFTQHVVRGLNVIVRLRKSCYLLWPRLLESDDKCNWITQNLDQVSSDDLYYFALDAKNLEEQKESSEDDSENENIAETCEADDEFGSDNESYES